MIIYWDGQYYISGYIFSNPAFSGPTETVLVVQDSVHAHVAESVDLTQVHSLAVDDASHGHSAESPVLTQVHNLEVQDSIHIVSSDIVTLTQQHILVVQDALHLLVSDNVDIQAEIILVVQDAVHTVTSTVIILNILGILMQYQNGVWTKKIINHDVKVRYLNRWEMVDTKP